MTTTHISNFGDATTTLRQLANRDGYIAYDEALLEQAQRMADGELQRALEAAMDDRDQAEDDDEDERHSLVAGAYAIEIARRAVRRSQGQDSDPEGVVQIEGWRDTARKIIELAGADSSARASDVCDWADGEHGIRLIDSAGERVSAWEFADDIAVLLAA
jgi:hypothetical protein